MKTLSERLRETARRLERADEVNALREAAGLLECMEPAEPEKITGLDFGEFTTTVYLCGACRMLIERGDVYCKHCGKPIKWGS